MKITVDAHRAIWVNNVNSQSWELEGMEKVKHSPPHTFNTENQSEFPLLNEKTRSIIKHLKKACNMEIIDNSKQANKKYNSSWRKNNCLQK